MSRYKRKGKAKFIMLERYLYRSPAWQALDSHACRLYLELKDRYDGQNNGRIALSCRDAATILKASKATASRAFSSLIENGFVRVSKVSGFNIKSRTATEYRLTEHMCDVTGGSPTKDFMKWTPDEKRTVSPEGHTVSAEGHQTAKSTEKHFRGFSRGTVKPDFGF